MNNLLIHRLGYVHQNRTDLENLLNLIRTCPDGCDEVWLCGAYGYPTIETHRAHGKAMAEAAKAIRALGVEVSLQISNTIGHGSYMKTEDYSGAAGIPGIVGPEGQENPWCFCPNSEAFRSYLREEITALCQCRPHVVWLDDDFRMVNHFPVMTGCFCGSCIAAFNRCWGASMTREELVQAIGYGPDPVWRERWVAFERESLASLAREIARTVRETSPESHMGLQHGEPPFYTGGSHDFIFDALAEASGKPVFSRPGAGFYQEHHPREMVDKALSLHLQNELLPESVMVSCAELEDLPHSPMGKSVRANCIEGTLDIAYGCRALSFTSLQNPYETDWHRRLFTGLAGWRPYWERLIAESRDTRVGGMALARPHGPLRWTPALPENPLSWTGRPGYGGASMLQMGLPLSFGEEACPAVLLHPETARALSDEELKALLHRPVMTSGETLSILAERGLSAALPVRAEPETTHELSCRLTGHPFNCGHQGETWSYCDFHGQDRTYILVPEAPDAEVLERYVHEGSGQEAGAASVKFRTAAGGEWVVFGSHFWDCNIGTGKRQQILQAVDALSSGRLPALLRTAAQVLLIPRVDADGMLKNLTLLNLSLDETGPLELLLRCPAETLELVSASRAEVLRPVPDGEGRCTAWVSSLSPWEAATIFVP